jgi:hypothetical protein
MALKYHKRAIWFILFIALPAQCNLFDALIPVTPYDTEAEAIADLKIILKYEYQCGYMTCQSSIPNMNESPSSCKKWKGDWYRFEKKYKVSSGAIKTSTIKWYIEKIDSVEETFC